MEVSLKNEEAHLYIIGDGDNIRNRVEFYLLNGNLTDLTHYSQNLLKAIEDLQCFARSKMGADIIYAGGDDLLFRLNKKDYERKHLQEALEKFQALSGSTISFGVGESVEEAFLNLRRAKAMGKGEIVQPRIHQ